MNEILTPQENMIMEHLNEGMWLMLKKGTETVTSTTGATVSILKAGTIVRLVKKGLVTRSMVWNQKINRRYILTDEGRKYRKIK